MIDFNYLFNIQDIELNFGSKFENLRFYNIYLLVTEMIKIISIMKVQ